VIDDDDNLVGVVSRNDVKRLSYISFADQKHIRMIREAMTPMPLTVSPRAYVSSAAGLMLKHKIHRLPVVEENKDDDEKPGKLIGIITRSDIWEPLIQNSFLYDQEMAKKRYVSL
jgi:CBS domain-containing protein